MKKYTLLIAILILTITSCQESKNKAFERAAEEYTKYCPREIDSFTQIDSMVYNSHSNTNTYYYTITGDADNSDSIRNIIDAQREMIIEGIISSIDLKPYKDFGTTFEFIYSSRKVPSMHFSIRVSPDIYQK